MLCGQACLVNEGRDAGVAITMRCRSWGCPVCAPNRRRQLIDLAIDGAPTRLITLTVNPSLGISPADRARRLARAWRLVVARAKRQLKLPTLDYLAVFEATKRGEPHLHILARCGYIPQHWLSAQMRDIINSPIVDIRLIKHPKIAAKYIAKYIGKAPHRFATCKRYWHTKNWAPPRIDQELTKKERISYTIVDKTLKEIIQDWVSTRALLIVETEGEAAWYGQPPPWKQRTRRTGRGAGYS